MDSDLEGRRVRSRVKMGHSAQAPCRGAVNAGEVLGWALHGVQVENEQADPRNSRKAAVGGTLSSHLCRPHGCVVFSTRPWVFLKEQGELKGGDQSLGFFPEAVTDGPQCKGAKDTGRLEPRW